MNASQQTNLEGKLTELWPAACWHDSHVVLAVSGGADSVAMLRAILEAKQRAGGCGAIYAAHLNHGWRGADADADQGWLEALCQKLGVPLQTARGDTGAIAAADGDGLEAAARKARYTFLTSAAERLGARYVAVAHTADDQIETVLHRILRGTGLEGLAGMPFSRPLSPAVALVRPLINVSRSEVLAYLSAIGQDYRTDPTNADVRWTRNRLRHQILPVLRERFIEGVDQAILRLAAQAGETQAFVSQLAERLAAACVRIDSLPGSTKSPAPVGHLRVNCWLLRDEPPLLVREVCKLAWKNAGWPMQSMGYDEWRELGKLVQNGTQASITLPANIQARREDDLLVLTRKGDVQQC